MALRPQPRLEQGSFFLMIRRPPRSTLFPYTNALPILVRKLLAYGADPDDSAALIVALENDSSIELIQTLLRERKNSQKILSKKYGLDALQRAIRTRNQSMIALFLEARGDVNKFVPYQCFGTLGDEDDIRAGENALATAIKEFSSASSGFIHALLSAGANINGI